MAYCPQCGCQIEPNATFCSNCGRKILSLEGTEQTKRKVVYHGQIRKCPACGEEVPSFTAICPTCGHEFHAGSVSSSIQDFTDKLQEYDRKIANASVNKRGGGWNNWGIWKKIGWVFLNLYTLCPSCGYEFRETSPSNAVKELQLKLEKIEATQIEFPKTFFLFNLMDIYRMSPVDRQKVNLIRSFAIPNNKEEVQSVLEFLITKNS